MCDDGPLAKSGIESMEGIQHTLPRRAVTIHVVREDADEQLPLTTTIGRVACTKSAFL